MFKRIVYITMFSSLLINLPLQSSITITTSDIQEDSQGFYYLYELTFADLSTASAKFEDDVSTVTNITAHKTLPAVPPYKPAPRWICAAAGKTAAELNYLFNFGLAKPDGLSLKIVSVQLQDKLVMQNNSKMSEDSAIQTSWSLDGTNWHVFNEASTPTHTADPVATAGSDTLNLTSNTQTFRYRVSFSNFDTDGFDENLNMWNYLTHLHTDHFKVKFRLAWDVLAGGTGTAADPFLISTPADLIYLGQHPALYDKCFRLTNDIDMLGFGPFTTALIAPDTDNTNDNVYDGPAFTGSFDGNGFSISNLRFSTTDTDDYVGLFGCIEEGSTIDDLSLRDVYIRSGDYVGPLAGVNLGTVTNCHASGTVNGYRCAGGLVAVNNRNLNSCSSTCTVSGYEYTGGLAGWNNRPINGCHAGGTVNGFLETGGLVGYNYVGEIFDSYSTGSVTGTEKVGGLVGHNHHTIDGCFSTGSVRGVKTVGGLVGGDWYGQISNCYTTATVYADQDYFKVGGFIGYSLSEITNCYAANQIIRHFTTSTPAYTGAFAGQDDSMDATPSASYTACFWDTDISMMTDAVGDSDGSGTTSPDPDPAGITGLPTATLKIMGLYTSQGWDFVNETANGSEDIWAIRENVTCPRFVWECLAPPAGDLNDDCRTDLLDFAIMAGNWLECGLMDENLCP